MKSLQFHYKSYELEFNKPFITSKTTHRSRKGFIIILTDDQGRKGFGEAAPFPEFGSESYEDIEKRLRSAGINININYENIEESIETSLRSLNNFPALRHGIEQALLKLISLQKNISLNELVNESSRKEIPVNAAVSLLPPDETLAKAAELISSGFTTLKLKAGRKNFDEDLECIKSIREKLGNEINLRIDVNGKWNLNEAVTNLERLHPFNLEYAEQPVESAGDLIKLSEICPVPAAPDESIRNIDDAYKFLNSKNIKFIILKPMMIGGLLPSLKIMNLAREKGIIPIVTTSLDSSVGRAFAVFAASTVSHNYAHGLGTAMYLKTDTYKDPYTVRNGKIILQ